MLTDLNDRIAKAKGWEWHTETMCYQQSNRIWVPDSYTYWTDPSGIIKERPDFVGTVEGVDGMMRELNETRAQDVKYYDWNLRWSALFQIWDFYGDDEVTEERRAQFQSTKEEGSGVAVGKAYVSVFEKNEILSYEGDKV